MPIKPYTREQANALVKDARRRMAPMHDRWRLYEHLYRHGTQEGFTKNLSAGELANLFPDLSLEAINLVLPALNIILASIVDRDPKHLAIPLAGGDDAEQRARGAAGLIGYFWRRTNGTADLRDMTQDCLVIGNGFGKTGWSLLETDHYREEDEVVTDLAELVEADRLLATLEDRDVLPVEELQEHVQVTTTMVEQDEPFIEYVSPYDMFLPANARRMYETRWVAQRITLPLEEITSNPTFSNTKHVTSDGVRTLEDAGHEPSPAVQEQFEGSDPFEMATVFEFYDMRSHRMLVFQEDNDKPLYDGEIPYAHRRPPFVHMPCYRDGGKEFWGFGEIENIARIQLMLNSVLAERFDNFSRSGNKYFVDEDAVTEDMREGLESSEPDVVIPVRSPNGAPLSEIVFPVPRLPLPDDVYAVERTLRDGLSEVLGLNDFMQGGVGADRMSATAAAITDGIATLRAQDKVKAVEDAASELGLHLLLLCQEFLDQARAVRIAGPGGAEWVDLDDESIHGEFEVRVEGGSTQSVNPATERQRGMDLIQNVVPMLAEYGYDPDPAFRSAMRAMGYDPEQLLTRPAQPTPPQPGALGLDGAPPSPGAPSATSLPTVPTDLGAPPVPAGVDGGIAL